MVAYTGVTTFLVNTDQVDKVPTSWQDIKDGDYKVALGPLTGGNAQAAVAITTPIMTAVRPISFLDLFIL